MIIPTVVNAQSHKASRLPKVPVIKTPKKTSLPKLKRGFTGFRPLFDLLTGKLTK